MLDALPEKRRIEAMVISNDVLATVKSRIIETGVDADGNPMGDNEGPTPYSDKVVPYWFYANKPSNRNAKDQAEKMRKKVGYFASYADWRRQHDLPVDKVTTVFTGEMWKVINPEEVEHNENMTVIEITARDDYNQSKLGFVSNQYGDLLRLNEEELTMLNEDNLARIEECHRQFGLL